MIEPDRLDRVLVTSGHFESRAAAQAAIAAGGVSVNGRTVTRASTLVRPGDISRAEAPHPWVSRGGLKLQHALKVFGVDPAGRTCLDVGASTGGFCDVLLSLGAARIYAVDVGHGQLHPRIAGNERITALEATDARHLTRQLIDEAPSLIVCDASFISLEKLLGVPLSLAADAAQLICLFKPQFEVGRANVGKGGIVTDQAAVQRAEEAFCAWLDRQGWAVTDRIDSPVTGGDGNRERLVFAAMTG